MRGFMTNASTSYIPRDCKAESFGIRIRIGPMKVLTHGFLTGFVIGICMLASCQVEQNQAIGWERHV